MNGIVRTILFLSAFAPAVLVSAVIHVTDVGDASEAIGWIAASVLACVLPLLITIAAAQQSEIIPFTAKKVESQDWLLVGFTISYFVPLIVKVDHLHMFLPIAILAAILLATLDAIPCHPVMHLFRYRFYKVEGANGTVYTLISRRRILAASNIKSVQQLSALLLLEA